MDAVDEQVERGEAGGEVTAPPPVVVLSAEVEVAEQDGSLGAGDAEDQKHQKQESKHVVGLGGPDRVEDEEELYEYAAEG